MRDAFNVFFLISAIFTCLALGVGVAHGLCNLMFAGMKLRAATAAPAPRKVAGIARV